MPILYKIFMVNYKTLQKLCTAYGPPGFESNVARIIMEELENEDFDFSFDHLGNVFVELGEGRPVALFAAHMDEVGLLVTHVTSDGFLKVVNLGGLNASALPGSLVDLVTPNGLVTGVIGETPPHLARGEKKEVTFDNLFIDIGVSSKEEVKKLGIDKGTPAVFKSFYFEDDEKIIGKALDDRVGCFVLLEALKRARDTEYGKVIVAFTVQEEVGCRGASTLAHRFNPDIGISIEGTIANDTPGTPSEQIVTRARGGAAIRLMDASMIANRRLVDYIVEKAKENNIDFQFQISPKSGTDARWFLNLGAKTSGISVPVRYIHSVHSMAFKEDVEAVVKLLATLIRENHKILFEKSEYF